jgi:hypothetical protein
MRHLDVWISDDPSYDKGPSDDRHVELLVVPGVCEIADFQHLVETIQPEAVIPPWRIESAAWTSRAFDRAKSIFPNRKIGIVVVGESDSARIDFFIWAQARGAAPIVLLPHKTKVRSRQMMDLAFPGYIQPNTWIHLPYPDLLGHFDDSNMKGNYSTSAWV